MWLGLGIVALGMEHRDGQGAALWKSWQVDWSLPQQMPICVRGMFTMWREPCVTGCGRERDGMGQASLREWAAAGGSMPSRAVASRGWQWRVAWGRRGGKRRVQGHT